MKSLKIMTREEILAGREPEWLIEEIIPQDSFAQLYGAPKSYKSFVALDAACSIATGRPFLDTFDVLRTGDVVYIYGEGGRGIGRRLRAWELANDCEATRFFGLGQPVDMLGADPDRVVEAIKATAARPALIVIDTLARCFGGGDENSTQDMNAFVCGCDRLRLAFPDCTVLVVHHCGWEGKRSRGSRALEGALDTIFQCKKTTRGSLLLTVQTQKEFPEPDAPIELAVVGVSEAGSAVVRPKKTKGANDERALEILRAAGDDGLTAGEWRQLCDINPNTHKDVRKRLKATGHAEERNRKWYAVRHDDWPGKEEWPDRGARPAPTSEVEPALVY